ncbi:SdpI family protein [Myroides odoratus]|uniref:SdpI family protein n=1 Tax=Myroides odoratus TaxID=256 RepID=UPI000765EEFA|nr:SdpI family protein [Myroides odoratus]
MTILYIFPIVLGLIGFFNLLFHFKQVHIIGYRSHNALKDDKHWRVAQRTSSSSLIAASLFLICMNYTLAQFDYATQTLQAIMITSNIFCVLYTIIHTETVLEKIDQKIDQNYIQK